MNSTDRDLVVSASRRTDIPAYFAEWMTRRIDAGYLVSSNPYSGHRTRIDLDRTRFFVFWTKHPSPGFWDVLDRLDERGVGYYVSYTLNDYVKEALEPGIPDLGARIDTFVALSRRIGAERVVWRFDPLVLTSDLDVPGLLAKIEGVGSAVRLYTRTLVFSFMDATGYRRVQRNLAVRNVEWNDWEEGSMLEFAAALVDLNRDWDLEITTCCETVDLRQPELRRGACVDPRLILRTSPDDAVLGAFLASGRAGKDTGQREACGCMVSRDIGRYETCPAGCAYCYASSVGRADIGGHNPSDEMLGCGSPSA